MMERGGDSECGASLESLRGVRVKVGTCFGVNQCFAGRNDGIVMMR